MDIVSGALAGVRAGNALASALTMNSVISVENNSAHDVRVAMCAGRYQAGWSGGWTHVRRGQTWAEEIQIPRLGWNAYQLVCYAESTGGSRKQVWEGDCAFYVVDTGTFLVRGALSDAPQLVSGNGRLQVVKGTAYGIGNRFTWTLT